MKKFINLFSIFKVLNVLVLTVTLCACQTPLNITDGASNAFTMIEANETIDSIEIYDDRAYQFIDEKTLISVRGKGFDWVEGPVWIDDGNYLLFSDIPKNLIRKFSLEKGNEIYLENTGFAIPSSKGPGSNGLLLNHENKLVLMQTGDRQIALMQSSLEQPKASFKALADNYQGMRLNGTNDGVFDRQGNLYFTDPPIGLDTIFDKDNKLIEKQYKWQLTKPRRVQETPFAGVYRLSVAGTLTLVDDTLTVPNGIGLSPDNKTLYVAVSDIEASAWYAFDVFEDGSLGNKRMFYNAQHLTGQPEQQGYPDGMVVHSSGIIFATGPGGVWLFDQKGIVLAKIKTGLLTSNCTFTTDEKYLFITADDFLLSIPLK